MNFRPILLTLAASCLAAPAFADALNDIRTRGVLRVAIPQDSPPFGSVGTDMTPQGYDIDIARLLAKELGVRVQMTPVSSSNRLPYLQTKKVDMIIYSLGKSPERETVIDFSIPYAMVFSGLFGRRSIEVKQPNDLANQTVGVSRGSLEDLELTKLAPASVIVKRFEDANTTMAAFVSGQVPLTASTNTAVAAMVKRNPQSVPELKFRIKTSPAYIGVGKGEPQLLQHVNQFITTRKANGELNALYQKWFGQPLPEMPAN